MIAVVIASVVLGPQLTRLPNGIPVIVDAAAGDLVTLQVLVRTDDLTPLELGAVETMAAALLGETENYSLRELRRLAWSIGGAVVAESAGDCMLLQITTTGDRLRPAAAFISDALRRPAFSKVALDEAREKNAEQQAWIDRTPPLRELRTAVAAKGLGPTVVSSLTQEQARSLHAKVVRPERVAISVVGNVDSDTVALVLGASLGHWQPESPRPAAPIGADAPRASASFRTALAMVKGPLPKARGFAAWMAACIAIGEGKHGHLNRVYRVERAQSYVLGSHFTFRRDAAYCTFYVSTTGEAPADFAATVTQYRANDADASRAKAYLIGRYQVGGPTEVGRFGGFAIGHETDAARAFWLAWWEMKGAGISKDAAFADEVRKLTTAEMAAATRDWLLD